MTFVGESIIARTFRNAEGLSMIPTSFTLIKGEITHVHLYGFWAMSFPGGGRVISVKIFRDLGDDKWTFIDEVEIRDTASSLVGPHILELPTPLPCEDGDYLGMYLFNIDLPSPPDAKTKMDYDMGGSSTWYQLGNISTTLPKTGWIDDGGSVLSVGVDIFPQNRLQFESDIRLEYEDVTE